MLKFLSSMVDPVSQVATDFFIEPPSTPGPREQSKIRHLVARSSDGRPEFAAVVPDNWSDEDLIRLVEGQLLRDTQ
jgi:hypothetical protein